MRIHKNKDILKAMKVTDIKFANINVEDSLLNNNLDESIKNTIKLKEDMMPLSFDSNKAMIIEMTKDNYKKREELFKIMKILKKSKFITPDMLNEIYEKNNTADENNFNLLQLSSMFGGPLNKKTFCVLTRKYVYTDENLFLDENTLNAFNKASYILCNLNNISEFIRIEDIETTINFRKNKYYTIIKVTLLRDNIKKTIALVPDRQSFEYYSLENIAIFLNIQKVGEILKKSTGLVNSIFENKTPEELSNEAFFAHENKIPIYQKREDDSDE